MWPFGLSHEEALVARGIILGLSSKEIGAICGWSASKSYALAKNAEIKVGCSRSGFKIAIDLADLPAPTRGSGYTIRSWSTPHSGKIDINNLRAMRIGDPEAEIEMRKASYHKVRNPVWWAGLSMGDAIMRTGKKLDEAMLIEAGAKHGYTVSRVTEDNDRPIIGRATYGIKKAPTLAERVIMAIGGNSRSKLVGVEVLAEAFGLDMQSGPKMILDAVKCDARIAVESTRDRAAIRLAE